MTRLEEIEARCVKAAAEPWWIQESDRELQDMLKDQAYLIAEARRQRAALGEIAKMEVSGWQAAEFEDNADAAVNSMQRIASEALEEPKS